MAEDAPTVRTEFDVLLSGIRPLPSYGEDCRKDRAEGLYDLAYQGPQPPQKGNGRINERIKQSTTGYLAHPTVPARCVHRANPTLFTRLVLLTP